MIGEKDFNRLIESAKIYTDDEYNRFEAETGWEDWMENYTDAAEGECITEREGEEINKILRRAFNIAHYGEDYNRKKYYGGK